MIEGNDVRGKDRVRMGASRCAIVVEGSERSEEMTVGREWHYGCFSSTWWRRLHDSRVHAVWICRMLGKTLAIPVWLSREVVRLWERQEEEHASQQTRCYPFVCSMMKVGNCCVQISCKRGTFSMFVDEKKSHGGCWALALNTPHKLPHVRTWLQRAAWHHFGWVFPRRTPVVRSPSSEKTISGQS